MFCAQEYERYNLHLSVIKLGSSSCLHFLVTHLEVKLELVVALGLVLQGESVLQLLSILQLEVNLSFVVDDLLIDFSVDDFSCVGDGGGSSTTFRGVGEDEVSVSVVHLEVDDSVISNLLSCNHAPVYLHNKDILQISKCFSQNTMVDLSIVFDRSSLNTHSINSFTYSTLSNDVSVELEGQAPLSGQDDLDICVRLAGHGDFSVQVHVHFRGFAPVFQFVSAGENVLVKI